jgi:hypothetical protein
VQEVEVDGLAVGTEVEPHEVPEGVPVVLDLVDEEVGAVRRRTGSIETCSSWVKSVS